jgi:hypothetical protein
MKNIIEANNQETANARRLYNGAAEKPEKPSPNLTDTPEVIQRKKLMVYLWAKMSQIFGGIWESSYGSIREPGIKTWMDALGVFADDEIRGAVELAYDWKREKGLIPTLPDFRSLCYAARKKPNFTERRIEGEEVKSLADFTKPRKTDGPIAIREKARMKRILVGEDVESRDESMTRLGLHRRWQA